MSETIDSLLVSLGLETDAKSFQKANDAIKGVKDGVLQLAAAAGVGLGFKSLTSDLAKSTVEMSRLSKITDFTTKQIRSLRFAMLALRQDPNAANGIVQKIPDLQQRAKQGELGTKAYWNGSFNPTEFANKSGMDALKYLVGAYGNMDNSQKRNLRNGIGVGDNDPLTRLMELGTKGLDGMLKDFDHIYKPLDPKLIESSVKFNQEMAKLSTNFDVLAQSMGGRLLPIVNGILEAINNFISSNPVVSETLLAAAGVGGTSAAMGVARKLLPGAKAAPAAGAGWMSNAMIMAGGYVVAASGVEAYDRINAMREGREYGGIQGNNAELSELERLKRENLKINSQKGVNRPTRDEDVLFSRLEKERGLPAGLLNSTYQNESGGGKHLLSPKGAMGPFQFMPDTAKDMGLNGNDVYDLEKSATAAADYYSQLLNRYSGDIPKAIAAYNHGMGNIDRKGLSNLPGETRTYIPNVISGMQGGEALLADYNYRRNQGPSMQSGGGTGSNIVVNQNNKIDIHAPGADANEINNRVASTLTDYSRQARDMMDTEHY